MRTAKFLWVVRTALPKWVTVFLAVGLLPIPGPVDEVALVVALAVLVIRHRPLVRVCWEAAKLETR